MNDRPAQGLSPARFGSANGRLAPDAERQRFAVFRFTSLRRGEVDASELARVASGEWIPACR